jgi:hypothetical protein
MVGALDAPSGALRAVLVVKGAQGHEARPHAATPRPREAATVAQIVETTRGGK